MIRINEHYLKLQESYLFSDIARRVEKFVQQNPERSLIKMGIGDVTRALPPACIKAFHKAVDEMASDSTFRGYGPEQGYPFLRQKIARHDFNDRGMDIEPDEIFVSDGAKCDSGNLQEIFAVDIKVAVPDPVYPVYVDTNVMAGRTGAFINGRYEGLVYLEGNRQNGFVAELPEKPVDLIYLCFPNNPTGSVIDRKGLQKWVDYAIENKALILFDAAYEAYITDDNLPHSIFEVKGAKQVAIEMRSFSKLAGFTGTRCAYTVVPKNCMAYTPDGNSIPVHKLWNRRHTTKFNSVSYPVQRAAEAVYSDEGKAQTRQLVEGYLSNARYIRQAMEELGYTCFGGSNAPYVWVDCKTDSWEFFDRLLNKAGVVCTPGVGFGLCGQGYVRLSAFNSVNNVKQAMQRIKDALS